MILPLGGRAAQGAGDVLVGSLLIAARYGFGALLVCFGALTDTAPVSARVLAVIGGGLVWLLGRFGRRDVLRGLDLVGSLAVDADSVTVQQTAMLSAPVTIRRERIARVLIDDDGSERFPVTTANLGWPTGFLWAPGRRCVLPLLHPGSRAPNVALLFDEPIDFPRRPSLFWRGPGRREHGLLVPVADAGAARAAFAGWPVGGALTTADVRRLS